MVSPPTAAGISLTAARTLAPAEMMLDAVGASIAYATGSSIAAAGTGNC